jgi:hypothetical protein
MHEIVQSPAVPPNTQITRFLDELYRRRSLKKEKHLVSIQVFSKN